MNAKVSLGTELMDIELLPHERLEVYWLAMGFVQFADEVAQCLPVTRSYLARRLQGLSSRIPGEIAQGAIDGERCGRGKWLRSAIVLLARSSAVLDSLEVLGLLASEVKSHGRRLLARIDSLLGAVCSSAPWKPDDEESGSDHGEGIASREDGSRAATLEQDAVPDQSPRRHDRGPESTESPPPERGLSERVIEHGSSGPGQPSGARSPDLWNLGVRVIVETKRPSGPDSDGNGVVPIAGSQGGIPAPAGRVEVASSSVDRGRPM